MSSNKTNAISINNISKNFAIYSSPSNRLQQMILPKLQKLLRIKEKQYYTNFNALNNVSFNIKKGDCVGIIGRNGAGKSTLLQIICGTLISSSGILNINGRVAALLELGSGFNPDFTGKENIFLNASILGLSKDKINEKYDDIVAFANIGKFINYPVKLYSSGMYVRLAFAIAIHVEPDILIIDEALSVGDEAFQRKCYSKIDQIKSKGCTVLFVSHSTQTIVELCDKALLIESGSLVAMGKPKDIVKNYQKLSAAEDKVATIEEIKNFFNGNKNDQVVDKKDSHQAHIEKDINDLTHQKNVDDSWLDESFIAKEAIAYNSDQIDISNIRIENIEGNIVNNLRKGYDYSICYKAKFLSSFNQVGFGMMIKTLKGFEVGGASTFQKKELRIEKVNKDEIYDIRIKFTCNFLPGTFFYNIGILSIKNDIEHYANRVLDAGAFRVMEEANLISTSLIDLSVEVNCNKIK